MTKLQIQEIYQSKLTNLSAKARFILFMLKLDGFDDFYNCFIDQKQKINFSQLKNCGFQTQQELIELIKTITNLSIDLQMEAAFQTPTKADKQKEMFFNREFEKLNVRAKNVLGSFGINDYYSFNERIIKSGDLVLISKIRNCGAKTTTEITDFAKRILQILHETNGNYDSNSLKTRDFVGSIPLTRKLVERNIFKSEEELLFTTGFDFLSNRTKNVLISSQANNLQGFVKNILNNSDLYDLKTLKNCGETTEKEIGAFKNHILDLLSKTRDVEVVRNLFMDLKIYIFDAKVLRPTENMILCNYFGYTEETTFKSLDSIAAEVSLTKERVRQITFSVLEKIKNIVCKITNNDKHYLISYFHEDFFTITPSIARTINIKEGTSFSSAFITYVLQCIEYSGYNFICVDDRPAQYSGFFYKKELPFNFSSSHKILDSNIPVKRKHDIKIKIDDLISAFMTNNSHEGKVGSDVKNQFVKAFKLLCECKYAEPNLILQSNEHIIFRRNTKQKLYDSIRDILNYYKKPLHFTEIFDECLKNGVQVSSALNIHSLMQRYPNIFGLKGPGIYGLIEWGGYFGTIGDVTEQLLRERNKPIDRKELTEILTRELYISQDSINTILFHYENENRFVRMKKSTIGLKEWLNNE